MRIGVTGAHGTGKTTLSKHIAGRERYRYLPETPFQAFQRGFTMNETTSMAAELWMFAKQVEQEQNAGEDWVADKCMIDLLAYAVHFFPDDKALLNVLTRVARQSFDRYQIILYLPIEFAIEDDGFRSLDPQFQEDIDRKIQGILSMYHMPHHRLTGTREERFAYVKRLLR